MNMPVLADWLTILLAPVVIVSAVLALSARRSAIRAGAPVPGWGKAAQGVVAVCVLLMALLSFL